MSRFTAINLSGYPLPDILETLTVETYLLRNKQLFTAAWDAIRGTRPPIDTLTLEHEPAVAQMRMAAELERLLRGHVNDRIKSVTLAGATGPMLDHLAMTYFRGLTRRIVTPATDTAPAVLEDDETFRRRIALSPESWSTCGPEGAYLFWALSASGDVLDVAAYSEDEGVCLAPRVRVAVLPRAGVNAAGVLTAVRAQLSRRDLRPLADLVIVEQAVELPFNVAIDLKVRTGASAAIVVDAARQRVQAYCEGRMRWIGDTVTGPVWLIGRRITRDTLAAAAAGGDPNILEVSVITPAQDVNPPHAGYTPAALQDVGLDHFVPLASEVTQHLFCAPRLGTLAITYQLAVGGTLG